MTTYYAILTCRNSEDKIEKAIISLLAQTMTPEYIIIINDGSTDKTINIIEKLQMVFKNLYVITNPDLGYNIGRVVSNWNKAIKFAKENNLPQTDYHMITTDDTEYEFEYAEKILRHMEDEKTLAIASGNYDDNEYITPHGAGRFVRNSFFDKYHQLYPEKMGYESFVLHTADHYGYRYKVFNEARFIHTRPLGTDHNFYEFGASMKTLGYHPLYVIGRFLIYLIDGKPIGRLGALHMIYHYLHYKPKSEGYDSMHDESMRKIIRDKQCNMIKRILRIEI